MQASNFTACLTALEASGSEFILVGGLAAVLHGAPVQTYLLTVLTSIDAIFRIHAERRLRPNISHLAGYGHLNLLTRFGPLDVLATIGKGLTFEDLLPHSGQMLITDAVRIKVLSLEFIIALKEELASEKDLAVLPTLRQTARELKKRQS